MHHLLVVAAMVTACGSAYGTTDAEAIDYLAGLLSSRGYPLPRVEISDEQVPAGADAATFGANGVLTIRLRPCALRETWGRRVVGTSGITQWQNLMRHEAAHYIDILQRGRSDHGPHWQRIALHLGTRYTRPRQAGGAVNVRPLPNRSNNVP